MSLSHYLWSQLQVVSIYSSYLNSSALCAVRTHESAYLRSPMVQMRSRLSYRPRGRMWRQKAPAEPTDGGCESIVFFHTDTLAKSPHLHGRSQVFARTYTGTYIMHTHTPPPPPPPPLCPLPPPNSCYCCRCCCL